MQWTSVRGGGLRLVLPAVLGLILIGCAPRLSQTTPFPTLTSTPQQAAASPTPPAVKSPTPIPSPSPTQTPEAVEVVETPAPLAMPLMGTEIHKFTPVLLSRFQEGSFDLVRKNALRWRSIEPDEGSRLWEKAQSLEKDLKTFSELGSETILIVMGVPDWAQGPSGSDCGPVKQEKLEAFAQFLSDAVARYSVPPYNVRYWELGNEPDVDPSLVPQSSVFGCWGDENDPYYGGRYYGEMLKVVYPKMKEANPDIQVLVGGLLLDCDPTNPPEGKDCLPARFLEGILEAEAGSSFDMVSFHSYYHFWGSLHPEELAGSFAPRGGAVLGKADYIREVLAQYDLEKPLMHTEGALLCRTSASNHFCSPPGDEYAAAQADYLVWLYIRNWAAGIYGTIWYEMEGPGWSNAGLLDDDQEPRPAFLAFQFLRRELNDLDFIRTIPMENDDLRIFEFASPDRRVWVAWALDQAVLLPLPDEVQQVVDLFGEEVSVEGDVLQVRRPIYLRFDQQNHQN